MSELSAADLLRIELWLILVGAALAIGYQALIGNVSLRGILSASGDGPLTMERVQLLVSTVAVAGLYLFNYLDEPTQFPEIPTALLLLLGGSNAGYVVAKGYGVARQRRSKGG